MSALKHSADKRSVWEALARLFLTQGQIDPCQEYCQQILAEDPQNESAARLLAESMFHKVVWISTYSIFLSRFYDFRYNLQNFEFFPPLTLIVMHLHKGEHSAADYHFILQLENNPNNYRVLANLIGALRCAGKLSSIEEHIHKAMGADQYASQHAGMKFCKGLQNRFLNKPKEALSCFNAARKDPNWATDSLFQMVGILLNPGKDIDWLEGEPPERCKEISLSAKFLLEQVRQIKHVARELPSRGYCRSASLLIIDASCLYCSVSV